MQRMGPDREGGQGGARQEPWVHAAKEWDEDQQSMLQDGVMQSWLWHSAYRCDMFAWVCRIYTGGACQLCRQPDWAGLCGLLPHPVPRSW